MLLTTRKQAKEQGSKTYFTGLPCKHGHTVFRYTSGGHCSECAAIRCSESEYKKWKAQYNKTEIAKAGVKKAHSTPKSRQSKNLYSAGYRATEEFKRWKEEYDATPKARKLASARNLKYANRMYCEDPQFKIQCILRVRQRAAIGGKRKVGSFIRDLGCTVEEVQRYLETHINWQSDWSWQNWGELWELDHIRAVALYDLEDRDQFLSAAHHTNLQPLSIEDHKEKTKEDYRLIRWFKREVNYGTGTETARKG
jgi:hypothetical protein